MTFAQLKEPSALERDFDATYPRIAPEDDTLSALLVDVLFGVSGGMKIALRTALTVSGPAPITMSLPLHIITNAIEELDIIIGVTVLSNDEYEKESTMFLIELSCPSIPEEIMRRRHNLILALRVVLGHATGLIDVAQTGTVRFILEEDAPNMSRHLG